MSRNPRQSLAVGRLCNVCKDKPQPPEARVPHADDKRGGKRLCSHRPDKNKRGAGILRVPSLFTPPTLSQQENPDYFPLLSPPPRPPTPSPPPALQKAGERREGCPSRSRWLSLGYFSAALYPNINFPEIRRHYATAAGRGWGWGARTSPVYVPARGRCNQSSHLKVASPLARQGSKSLCNECPAHACRRRPAPRTARSPPGCRRPRAPGAGGEPGAGPGRQWAERLPCSCSRAGEQGGGEKERGPGAGPAALGLGLGPGSRAEARARLGRRVARGSAGAVAEPGDVC